MLYEKKMNLLIGWFSQCFVEVAQFRLIADKQWGSGSEYVIQNEAEWLSHQQSAARIVTLCICRRNKVINTVQVINKQLL